MISILGMGFPSISTLNQNPFFITAFAQHTAKANEFSFKLASTGSELFIGGKDASKYTGAVEFHHLSSMIGYWQLGGAKALVGGTTVVSGFQTIIDTGTTIMFGPPDQVAALYAKIPGSAIFDPKNGFYSFPCNGLPIISLSWGGKNWPISTHK
jgi:cathepsin D